MAEIDDAGDQCRLCLRLTFAPHGAESEIRLAITHEQSRNQGVEVCFRDCK
jgi:hypothetical protein